MVNNTEEQNNSILNPESLARALQVLLQEQDLYSFSKADLESEVDTEQDSEQEAKVKGKFEVNNGNSWVAKSGNSRTRSQEDSSLFIIFLILLLFGGYGYIPGFAEATGEEG